MGACISSVPVTPGANSNSIYHQAKSEDNLNSTANNRSLPRDIDLEFLLSHHYKKLSELFILYLGEQQELAHLYLYLEMKTLDNTRAEILPSEYQRVYGEYIATNRVRSASLSCKAKRNYTYSVSKAHWRKFDQIPYDLHHTLQVVREEVHTILSTHVKNFRQSTYFQQLMSTYDIPSNNTLKDFTRTLLFCCSDSLFSDVIIRQMMGGNFKVDLAVNSTDAVNKLKSNKYDAVLIDVELKGKNISAIFEEYMEFMQIQSLTYRVTSKLSIHRDKSNISSTIFLALMMTDDEQSRTTSKHIGFSGVLQFPNIGQKEILHALPLPLPLPRKRSIVFGTVRTSSYESIARFSA